MPSYATRSPSKRGKVGTPVSAPRATWSQGARSSPKSAPKVITKAYTRAVSATPVNSDSEVHDRAGAAGLTPDEETLLALLLKKRSTEQAVRAERKRTAPSTVATDEGDQPLRKKAKNVYDAESSTEEGEDDARVDRELQLSDDDTQSDASDKWYDNNDTSSDNSDDVVVPGLRTKGIGFYSRISRINATELPADLKPLVTAARHHLLLRLAFQTAWISDGRVVSSRLSSNRDLVASALKDTGNTLGKDDKIKKGYHMLQRGKPSDRQELQMKVNGLVSGQPFFECFAV
ncbi:uncharacterized protein B0H18DRAFT_658610 [Fomitopsis serialis]|uniref:uncharacterized protein n=1 Tax=Fomitopsis serialis TaxID=139415 RepID=UPI002007BE45|nr:uncharacterized protein B0H18DRAFT_658610 [Neoantrodia serialis]KAH9919056.1 hypothetical protein B0H18DRAFT_658610 [Neoantrodia serialis]